jgi:hypothetical protein
MYGASVTTYDQPLDANGNVQGNVLSQNQALDFTVSAGQSNSVPVTLFGIPASLQFVASATASNAIGSPAVGYVLYGTADVPFDIIAQDADGNYIAGPGSPQYSVTSSGSQVIVDAQPSSAQPSRVLLRGPAFSDTTATVTASISNAATYGASCGPCTVSLPVSAGALLVRSQTGGSELVAGMNTAVAQIPYSSSFEPDPAIDSSLTVPSIGSSGVVFFGYGPLNYGEAVPPFSSAPSPLASNLSSSGFDLFLQAPNGTLYGAISSGSVATVYSAAPPYTSLNQEYTLSPTVGGDRAGLRSLAATASGGLCIEWEEGAAGNTGIAHVDIRLPGSSIVSEIATFSASAIQLDALNGCSVGADGSILAAFQNGAMATVITYEAPQYATQYTYSTASIGSTDTIVATTDPQGRMYVADVAQQSAQTALYVVPSPYTSASASGTYSGYLSFLFAPTTAGVYYASGGGLLNLLGPDLSVRASFSSFDWYQSAAEVP